MMNKRELIEAIKILEKHGILSYDEVAVIEIMINENNSLAQVEAPRVRENEQAKEDFSNRKWCEGIKCRVCDEYAKCRSS